MKFRFFQKIFSRTKSEKFNSSEYWEQRYSDSGNSGPGSYGRLAKFKADILNNFVAENDIQSVIELGCGDGNQLSLCNYPNYIGADVSETALKVCQDKFRNDIYKSFYNWEEFKNAELKSDLTVSLDVIYHLVEDQVFHEYMVHLFNSANKYVIIYSSNRDEIITKHVKCRKFTNWVEENIQGKFKLINVIENNYPFEVEDPNNTSYSDFFIYKREN